MISRVNPAVNMVLLTGLVALGVDVGAFAAASDRDAFREPWPGYYARAAGGMVVQPGAVILARVIRLESPVGAPSTEHPISTAGTAIHLEVRERLAGDCPDTLKMWCSARVHLGPRGWEYVAATGEEGTELSAVGTIVLVDIAPSVFPASPLFHRENAALWWPQDAYWIVRETANGAKSLESPTAFILPQDSSSFTTAEEMLAKGRNDTRSVAVGYRDAVASMLRRHGERVEEWERVQAWCRERAPQDEPRQ